MLLAEEKGEMLNNLDQIEPATTSPNTVSVSDGSKSSDGACVQEWREMVVPATSATAAAPIHGITMFPTVSMTAMDTFWFPRSSSVSDDTPQKIRRGFNTEKDMTFLTCCRQYPKAIGWSLVLFLTIVMEAYDKSLISGFLAFPAFRRKYGQKMPILGTSLDDLEYEIPPAWQIGLQNAAFVCEIIGLLLHGYITYIIGYRKVMIGSLLWLCLSVFPAVFAKNITTLLISQALSGTSHNSHLQPIFHTLY